MAAQALEQSALEGKDKDQLLQIAKALSVKGVSKLKKADLVIILTDHSSYDYDLIVRHAEIILDSRNATRNVKTGRSKIHKL